jgi:hypothetical protein
MQVPKEPIPTRLSGIGPAGSMPDEWFVRSEAMVDASNPTRRSFWCGIIITRVRAHDAQPKRQRAEGRQWPLSLQCKGYEKWSQIANPSVERWRETESAIDYNSSSESEHER